ncbi:MAG: CoA-binding protein [Flavobacteriaceae bacterium]|jgi:predicted CoA-binding protein|nr:CoA-binding protein [Flavobacteriaceae bacterium]
MKTLVIGGSTNPERYSFKAISMLREFDHEVVSYGLRTGIVADVMIDTEMLRYEGIDTVTLYLNPKIQEEFYEYILSLNPRRVIFNPGTENPVFEELLQKKEIIAEEACTLVLLRTNQY